MDDARLVENVNLNPLRGIHSLGIRMCELDVLNPEENSHADQTNSHLKSG